MLSWEDDRNDSMRLDVGISGMALVCRHWYGRADYWIDDTGKRYEDAREVEVVSPVFQGHGATENAARWLHKNLETLLKVEAETRTPAFYGNGAGTWKLSEYAERRTANRAKRETKKAGQ